MQQGVKAKVNNSSSYQQQKKSIEIVKVREIKAAEPEMPEKRTRSFIFFLYLKKSFFSKNVHSFNLISVKKGEVCKKTALQLHNTSWPCKKFFSQKKKSQINWGIWKYFKKEIFQIKNYLCPLVNK